MAVAVAFTVSGPPAGLGSQFSLYPGGRRQGRQSSEGGGGHQGEKEAEVVGTRKELGDVNESGVEIGPSARGGDGQNGFLGLFLH